MILFFTSLQMVCLDEIDNYVELVLISCMACTDLDCHEHDTGYPFADVSIYVQRERRSEDDMWKMIGFFRILVDNLCRKFSNITWRKQKNAPSNLQTDCRKPYGAKRLEGWGLGRFGWFSHRERTPANLQSRNYLEQAMQQTDLPGLLTLSCQHAVRTKPL